jgi:hypothetical protein
MSVSMCNKFARLRLLVSTITKWDLITAGIIAIIVVMTILGVFLAIHNDRPAWLLLTLPIVLLLS